VRGAQGTVEATIPGALEELKPTGIIATNGRCHEDVRRIVFRNL